MGSAGMGEPASTEISARRPGSTGARGRGLGPAPLLIGGSLRGVIWRGSESKIGGPETPPLSRELGGPSSIGGRGRGGIGLRMRAGSTGTGVRIAAELTAAAATGIGGGGAARGAGRAVSTRPGPAALSSSGAPQNLQNRLPATQFP
jgi:hypothetical protein